MNRELKHFGVLGMRWGKRKSPEEIKVEKLAKDQKKWDKKAKKNWLKAYNRAVDYTNAVLIPKINKKYGKYDWSNLDTSDPNNPKGDPKLVASYKRYIKEYEKSFTELFDQKLVELVGERPK